MSDKPNDVPSPGSTEFSQQVGIKAARKVKAQREVTQTVWSGLGMMGMIGWSVSVPTLVGAAIGLWVDKHHPGEHSWTLALLTVGLGLGCLNAWRWITNEERDMHGRGENDDA